jgi:hypothetical protein
MKNDEVKARLDFITSAIINAHLAQPATEEEAAWVAALRQDGDTEAEDRIARELYWEWRLGLDDQWPTPTGADFDSAAEYQDYLAAVA